MDLFNKILISRGMTTQALRQRFLQPDYANTKYDPFLLPDMQKAVERLKQAHQKQELIQADEMMFCADFTRT